MSEKTGVKPSCSSCSGVFQKQGATNCWSEPGQGPAKPGYCPSDPHAEIIREAFESYRGDDFDARLARMAAKVEGLCYQPVPGSDAVNARWTRVEDTIALCRLMGFKKIGIATCIGLLDETRRLSEILAAQGLEPFSACCKAGSIDKLDLNLKEENKVRPNTFEPACNPIAQARICNAEQTDMNIIMGLCVGHDMLFSKYADAPVTTLVAKDRVTGHNPVSVLYGQNFYYKRLQKQPVLTDEELKEI
ncbi:DUF1847 domain-containing protein [Geothermobacter hydrogeniphilus]|uniref:Metal-binding protein n=1 Tax=Geothermobacter hydrogeniphilus TaxID=1969733 RepID=A0A1X0Y3X3_9BACT|nr:DUF1847 domain-containing protein [Geothermobacter hydrogeniphilus]ORJ59777.1 hypothetical protein B5V00_08865 [Geothermobacter hydrogeniphilus]